jgi:two-component system phosphate regulon sensor histidine kinase PhoR
VINGVKIQVEKKGGLVKTDFKTENVQIIGDKVHISNVFYNLLDNAVKYSHENPQIKVTLENGKNGYLVAAVSDNGIGINKSEQKKIFEKLYRVSTGNIHNVKGFGLGLSYVKAIVEKHDGNILLESEPNKGTTVKVYLPKYNEQ